MKKILILNGAGKRNGNTARLINSFKAGAEVSGNEVKEFYLQNMNIHGCLDCQGCARKPAGTVRACVQNDDMNEIYDYFAECDILVFASPVYWFDITGTLKTAVDRLYAPQRNNGFDNVKKDTILIMTAGAPVESNPVPLMWYSIFSQLGWKDLGRILGSDKIEEARHLGLSIR